MTLETILISVAGTLGVLLVALVAFFFGVRLGATAHRNTVRHLGREREARDADDDVERHSQESDKKELLRQIQADHQAIVFLADAIKEAKAKLDPGFDPDLEEAYAALEDGLKRYRKLRDRIAKHGSPHRYIEKLGISVLDQDVSMKHAVRNLEEIPEQELVNLGATAKGLLEGAKTTLEDSRERNLDRIVQDLQERQEGP